VKFINSQNSLFNLFFTTAEKYLNEITHRCDIHTVTEMRFAFSLFCLGPS